MDTTKKSLVIATHNQAKLVQMKEILQKSSYRLLSLADVGVTEDVEETGITFEENALLKAQFYAKETGMLTLSDDSGLEVDALGGEPGIYSSRYAGPDATEEEKIAFLLKKLQDIPEDKRSAAFRSVVALAWPDGTYKLYPGASKGNITFEPRGSARSGFPYYRIYVLEGQTQTIAELEDAGIVYEYHRHQALGKVVADLDAA